jgi:nitrous oxidase accessory protein
LFRSGKTLIEGNTIEDGRDVLLWYSDNVTVRRNISRRNRYGFHTMFANNAHFEDNEITDNSVGIYLMYGRGYTLERNRINKNRGPSGYAIGLKEVDVYRIDGNLLAGNRVALYLDGSPLTRRAGKAGITNNTIAGNDIGISILPAVKGNLIQNNNFIDNIEQFTIQGRGNAKNNRIEANYWSDYIGYDRNRDAVGDQPYESRKLFGQLMDREPKLRLMLFSPAHDAIEFIGKAMPAVQPSPRFTDTLPHMKPIDLAVPEMAHAPRQSMARAAVVLLILPAIVLIHACRNRFAGGGNHS